MTLGDKGLSSQHEVRPVSVTGLYHAPGVAMIPYDNSHRPRFPALLRCRQY